MKIKTLFSAAVLHTAFLFPNSASWTNAAGGNWSTAANWTAGGPPNAAGDTATFPEVGPVTVTVDANFIVGTLSFTNTANAYTIAGSGANSLNLTGSAGAAAITYGAGAIPSNTITVPMVLTNPLTITVTTSFSINGVMSGPGSLTNAGTGFVSISGANTYSGGTTVNDGQLNCGGTATIPASGTLTITSGAVLCQVANALASSGAVNITGGNLNLNNLSQAIGSLSGTGGSITLGTATLTSNTSTATTYSGTMTGSGGFTLTGSGGMLTLATSPAYTGTTTVSGSTLFLNPGVTLPSGVNSNLIVNGPGVLNLNNNTQTVATLSGTGAGSIILGSGSLTSNPTASSTFAGVISGTGSFTLNGSSTLLFTGNNTYTSGTTINTGATLQLGINNALAPTGPVNIVGTGILDMTPAASTVQAIGPLSGTGTVHLGATQLTINETSNTSFTGSIDGTGSLVMAGPGTLTMNTGGTKTYTGGTFITGGILQLGASEALPLAGNLTINSPGRFDMNSFAQTVGLLSGNGSITTGGGGLTVLIPSGMSSTFSGVISQSGSLVVGEGAARGTLILTGANTYSGNTTVAANATLQGNSTSLQGNILNNGSLIFNQTFSGTYSGSLTGVGTLTLTGGSNLTLAGVAPTQNSTIVNAGELIIGSGVTLHSPTVTVNPGGALGPVSTGGTGTIIGNVGVSGTTILGLGTLHTTGTYTQLPGSTFDVEVSSSSSGLLANIGTVTLSGSPAIDISFEPGAFAPSKTYTLITSTTPVAGIFAAPIFENPFFEGSLIYNAIAPGSVQLVLKIGPFDRVIKGGNAGAIAECIDVQAFPQEANILSVIDTLVFLPLKDVRKALNEIQPSQLKALGLTEENNLIIKRSAISQHVDDFYKTDCNQAVTELYQWSVWGNFSGDFLRQEGQRENIGYSADTFGVTSGIDGHVGTNLLLGTALGYNYSWLDWSNSRGHGAISSLYLGPYFTWFNNRVFTNVSLLGSFNRYDASRHITFPGVDVHAKNHHLGSGLIGHFDLGVRLYPSVGMTCSPIVGLDYIHIWEQSYTEHGAPGLNMKILSTQASLFRTELGLEIAKCAILVHNKWTHDLKLSWIHQFPITGEHLSAQFADVNCTYTVKGLEPNQDYIDIATGLTGLFMKDRLSAALRYEGKFGDGIRDNTAYAQITYRF